MLKDSGLRGRAVVTGGIGSGRGGSGRSLALRLLSLPGPENSLAPAPEYSWQAHAVARAEAVSDRISEVMEMVL